VGRQRGAARYLPVQRHPGQRHLRNGCLAPTKATIHLDHSGYTGPDIWRVGFNPDQREVQGRSAVRGIPDDRIERPGARPPGPLVIATWSGRSIDRIEKNGKRNRPGDRWQGKRFGGTTTWSSARRLDLFHRYHTAVIGCARKTEEGARLNAVYMLRDNKTVAADQRHPEHQCLAFSPDEKFLYVTAAATVS